MEDVLCRPLAPFGRLMGSQPLCRCLASQIGRGELELERAVEEWHVADLSQVGLHRIIARSARHSTSAASRPRRRARLADHLVVLIDHGQSCCLHTGNHRLDQ